MADKANSHFSTRRGNKPTYECHVCKRLTRETGLGESGLGLCAFCFEEATLENEFADGYIDDDEFGVQLADLKARYKR